jgi:NAD+ diphosphatase
MFVSLIEPPEELHGDSVWFCVRGGDIVVLDDWNGTAAATHYLGHLDGRHCWAVDVDPDAAVDHDVEFLALRSLYGRLEEDLWTLAGRAVQIVEWGRTHRFCGRCGTGTEPVPGERARRCPACGLLAFPRLAPAVIVLVERDGQLLLAQGRAFGIPMYSTLAGFVEPGETLEEAVHREIHEEVGIRVTDVRYFGSQPWPFPHSLMCGFTARWESGDIVLQESEIVDARWFDPDDLPMIPGPPSIARKLIDGFLATR